MTQENLPTSWLDGSENETLEGLDLADKEDLKGVPFRILGVQFRISKKNYQMVVVDVETAQGEEFSFQDSSSTGVRAEIVEILEKKERDDVVDSGEYFSFLKPIVIPRGLRVSEYDPSETLGGRGRTRPGEKRRTYYLTRLARPRPTVAPATPATRAARKAATPAS